MVATKGLVLIADDEENMVLLLKRLFEHDGFQVEAVPDGMSALERSVTLRPALILMDVMMPGLDGFEVVRQLRQSEITARIPTILISAAAKEPTDIVKGLGLGADDYVVKPYSVVELMARVRAQLRRTRPASMGEVLEFEDIRLDAETHRVTRGGELLKLGPTEFRLLSTFMEKPGRVWTREQLLDRVWGREIYVDTRTVDVHVGRLRKALCRFGGSDPVRTVRGAGYALG